MEILKVDCASTAEDTLTVHLLPLRRIGFTIVEQGVTSEVTLDIQVALDVIQAIETALIMR